jgi:hypothetical protein
VRRTAPLIFVLSIVASVARAQQPVAQPVPASSSASHADVPLVEPDSSAPFVRPDGAMLRAGTVEYDLSLVRSGQPTLPLGRRVVQITDATVGGVPGWLIAESRTGSAVPTTDSLWVTRADLSPERWAATVDRTRLGASFTRDSVFGAVQSYRGRSSFGVSLPPDALITGGMIDALVSLLPLRIGYRASGSLLLVEPGAPRALPAELLVEREERVRAGGSDVDCWVVLLHAGVMEERRWVAKDAPRVLRTEQALASGVLISELRQ